jgi:rRNA-processing protein FCF1
MSTHKIRDSLENITSELCKLIELVEVKRRRENSGVVFVAPKYFWGELVAGQESIQFKIKNKYDVISELLKIIFKNAPNGISDKVNENDENFRKWLEFDSNWELSPSHDENKTKIKAVAGDIGKLIDILEVEGTETVVIVPDTNSLLQSADPTSYTGFVNTPHFTFLLLPTVLGELDSLKVLHRNQDVRDKAKKVIQRIKGWRNQGSLTEGVTVSKSIKVIAEHKEPDLKNSLSWLDPSNSDDRIIASVLSVKCSYPSAKVILITSDINLQNKADAAMIDVLEL